MNVEILTDDEAVKGLAYPIEVKAWSAGSQQVPSAATVTVKAPDGTEKVSAAAMSIDSNGTMTYTLASTYTATLWESAVLEINYTLDSITHKIVFLFDVVLCRLKPTVTDADLKFYFPQLTSDLWAEESNYDKQVQEAFRLVKRDIKDKGRRPAMLIDGMQVRELLILKAFELIFFSFAKGTEDVWWSRYQEMRDRYREQFEKLTIRYDKDEDALIDEDEKIASLGQITLER